MEKRRKKFTGILAALCFAMALVVLLSSAGATLAKYIRQDESAGLAVASPFYFTSDKLGENGPYCQISQPGDGSAAEISFTLSNFVDRLRCTSGEIRYSCWAVSGTDTSAQAIANTLQTGKISGEFQTAPIAYSLQASDFSGGVVTVIAQAESPYQKTLTAQFGFADRTDGLQWEVEEQGGTVVMELAGGNGGNVTVTWPEGLCLDPSDSRFAPGASRTVTFSMSQDDRYGLVFLKTDPGGVFTKDQFTVTQAGS